jgi:hypothetical protein
MASKKYEWMVVGVIFVLLIVYSLFIVDIMHKKKFVFKTYERKKIGTLIPVNAGPKKMSTKERKQIQSAVKYLKNK